MKNIYQLIQTTLNGLHRAENYLREDLDAICDETMHNYASETLNIIENSINQVNEWLKENPENQKKFEISYVLGTEAVRKYSQTVDMGQKWDVSSLRDCGGVAHASFDTQAELDAYKRGIEDATGYLESEQMMTDDEWNEYLEEYFNDEEQEE